eukprot:CAMPEP_0176472100 /NCGR_PEP_ID=MMETSP0127-20121128/41552_1 /TAXON_ID=938130 /ORGANISM="Platyophrya macrostoma, Strain WH" /LENGTH=282 /DNA_ID=CAMNT_0017866925 /DNA_START=6 /DNA_END=854 /DNA_ORIENTATION=+
MEAAIESRKIEIKELNKVIEELHIAKPKWFVVIDKSGIVETFMKYQGPNIWKAAPGEVTSANISKKFLVSAQYGQWLVLNFGDIPHDHVNEPIFGTDLVPWNFLDMEWVNKYPNIEEFAKVHFPDVVEANGINGRLSTKDSFKVMLIGSKNLFPTEVLKKSHVLEVVSPDEKQAWLEEQEQKKQAALESKEEEKKAEPTKESTTKTTGTATKTTATKASPTKGTMSGTGTKSTGTTTTKTATTTTKTATSTTTTASKGMSSTGTKSTVTTSSSKSAAKTTKK